MIHRHKLGLAVGGLLGLWHAAWALLVVLGWAQPFLDFIFKLHFINPPYKVVGYDPVLAIGLIIVTSLLGYLIGWVLGALWNKVNRA